MYEAQIWVYGCSDFGYEFLICGYGGPDLGVCEGPNLSVWGPDVGYEVPI